MPNRQPSSRRTVLLPILTAVLALAVGAGGFLAARAATFTDQASVSGNSFTTDTLAPPTGLAASVVNDTDIRLDWTPTADTYATGYRALRGTTSGGPYTQIATVTPYTATTYTDVAPTPGVGYYYVVQTYFQSWLSVPSNQVYASRPLFATQRNPTAEAAVTSNSGDNNGFEINPTYAFAYDANYAEDVNSGTAGSQDCASIARDRHLFYNYGFSIPGGQVISGILVSLYAWADSTADSPKMCVELSWNGGTTWTAAKTTTNLTTSKQNYYVGWFDDTWGRTWSSTEFSNANFRVRITNIASSTDRDFRLDRVAVQLMYHTPP